jgi:hypothetical protein
MCFYFILRERSDRQDLGCMQILTIAALTQDEI